MEFARLKTTGESPGAVQSDAAQSGTAQSSTAQFSLRTLLLIVTGSAVLLAVWPWQLHLFGQLLVGSWSAATLGFLAAGLLHLRALRSDSTLWSFWQVARHRIALVITLAAFAAPTACLGFFIRVFLGGGSNVAQFAGEGGMHLWSLWLHAWDVLAPLCLLSVPLSAVGYFVFFRPRRNTAFFMMRLCALASALISAWVVTTFFPDA